MSRDRERIRTLNDQARLAGPIDDEGVLWLLTPGVRHLGEAAALTAIGAVIAFEAFDRANDPHGEHDFGSFELAGERLLWKIDYYDRSLSGGSATSPASPAGTEWTSSAAQRPATLLRRGTAGWALLLG